MKSAATRIDRRALLAGSAVTAALAARPTLARSAALARNEDGVVFVGAGINSLAAAYLLARAGRKVLVLERNEVVGGAVRTEELTLPGFRHDLGAMNLSVLAGSPFFREHRAALAAEGVELVTADHAFGSFDATGRFLGITTDREANVRAIARFSEADARAWRAWGEDFDRCAPHLFRILSSPARASDPLVCAFESGFDVPEEAGPALRGILTESLRRNLGRRFESDVVQALIAAWGMHLDCAPGVSGGCWMPFLETNADERYGIAMAKGGSGSVTRALAALVVKEGGAVRTGVPVQRILVQDGRVHGVRLAGGEVVPSALVVASVTPTALLRLVGSALPTDRAQRARRWRYGPGTMVVHLALSGPPGWTEPAARKSFYLHVGRSLEHLAGVYMQALAGTLTADPFVVVGQPTLFDPSRAPQDKHVLWVMVRSIPEVIERDAAGEIEGPDWTDAAANAFADRVVARLEQHAPGLRGRILARAVVSPTELERLNPNLVGGDLNAGSMHLDQFYGRRPFAHGSREVLPGLLMVGASTWPGGGANTGSGELLAREILGA